MKQGKVFSCQVIHFSAKNIWNKIIQIILLTFNPRFWFSLVLNFSDLCEGEVEGQRLIFLSFSPQIKEIERREMEEKCQFSGLCPYPLRYFISPSFLGRECSRRKRGGNGWNEEGGKVSSFYLHLLDFFPPFLQEGNRLDESILKNSQIQILKS